MKCAACGGENPQDANFCNTCGTGLASKCPRCGFENPPEANFCSHCGAGLGRAIAAGEAQAPAEPGPAASPREVEGERRQLTVLFSDLVGSTELSERFDPEDYREIVRAYHKAAEAVVARFDGHIAQYLGDGIVVYFGWPRAHGDDAERAVRAGLALLDALGEVNRALPKNERIAARVGIHTGPVVVGEVGGGSRYEVTALGETPNVAARVQALGEPNSVVVTGATNRLAPGMFIVEELGARALKGVSQPIELYRVRRPSGVRSRIQAAGARGLTPFIGREHEQRLLSEHWELAQEGEGQVILISGEAGIGKSRLVEQFRQDLVGTTHTWLEGFCSPYGQGTPFAPVIELLSQLLAWRGDESEHERLAALETSLEAAELRLEEAVPLVAGLLNLPVSERYAPPGLSSEQARKRLVATLANWLGASARAQPVVMVLEDLHWADPSTLELQWLLVEQAATEPMMLIYTARPEFRAPWPQRTHHAQLSLGRLSRAQTREMAERVAVQSALGDELMQAVVARTDGVPLFIEELTKALIEPGRAAVSQHEIPATLQESLIARLDRLEEAKEIAQIASVIGREFSYAMLAAVAGKPEDDLASALSRLVDAELVHVRGMAPAASYVFKHALVQDTAYQSLLKTRRKFYHQRIAETLEQKFPQASETQPELLAHHYSEAALPERAIAYWRRAGERAAQRSSNAEAVGHFRRALALLEALPARTAHAEEELSTLLAFGPALMTTMSSSAPEVQQVYARARSLARDTSRLAELFATMWGSWLVAFSSGDRSAVRKFADELLAIAQAQQDPAFLLQAHHAAWPTALSFDDLKGVHEHAEAALALYRKEAHRHHALVYGGHDPAVCAYTADASVLQILGYPERALLQLGKGLGLARELAHPPSLIHALWFGAEVHFLRRDPQMIMDLVEEGLPIVAGNESTAGVANALILRGWALVMRREHKAGLAELRHGLDRMRATGSKFHAHYRLGRAVDGFHEAGENDEGLALLSEAFQAMETIGERWYEAELRRLKGVLILELSPKRREDARACFRRALDVARAQGARLFELRAAIALSRLDDGPAERALLRSACDGFTEGLNTPDLIEARALLDQAGAD